METSTHSERHQSVFPIRLRYVRHRWRRIEALGSERGWVQAARGECAENPSGVFH
jgi:hypothetical protein